MYFINRYRHRIRKFDTIDNTMKQDKVKEIIKNISIKYQSLCNEVIYKDSELFMSINKHKASITLENYLYRLVACFNKLYEEEDDIFNSIGLKLLLVATVYIDRCDKKVLHELSIHRLFVIAMYIACKIVEDKPISADMMSYIGGIQKKEIIVLESHFCNLLKFEFHVKEFMIIMKLITFKK